MPAGVHDAKPGSSKAIEEKESLVTPSTSLCGTIAPNAALLPRARLQVPLIDAPMDCQERIVTVGALRTPPERRSA
jgi:hypothetical protein